MDTLVGEIFRPGQSSKQFRLKFFSFWLYDEKLRKFRVRNKKFTFCTIFFCVLAYICKCANEKCIVHDMFLSVRSFSPTINPSWTKFRELVPWDSCTLNLIRRYPLFLLVTSITHTIIPVLAVLFHFVFFFPAHKLLAKNILLLSFSTWSNSEGNFAGYDLSSKLSSQNKNTEFLHICKQRLIVLFTCPFPSAIEPFWMDNGFLWPGIPMGEASACLTDLSASPVIIILIFWCKYFVVCFRMLVRTG